MRVITPLVAGIKAFLGCNLPEIAANINVKTTRLHLRFRDHCLARRVSEQRSSPAQTAATRKNGRKGGRRRKQA